MRACRPSYLAHLDWSVRPARDVDHDGHAAAAPRPRMVHLGSLTRSHAPVEGVGTKLAVAERDEYVPRVALLLGFAYQTTADKQSRNCSRRRAVAQQEQHEAEDVQASRISGSEHEPLLLRRPLVELAHVLLDRREQPAVWIGPEHGPEHECATRNRSTACTVFGPEHQGTLFGDRSMRLQYGA